LLKKASAEVFKATCALCSLYNLMTKISNVKKRKTCDGSYKQFIPDQIVQCS